MDILGGRCNQRALSGVRRGGASLYRTQREAAQSDHSAAAGRECGRRRSVHDSSASMPNRASRVHQCSRCGSNGRAGSSNQASNCTSPSGHAGSGGSHSRTTGRQRLIAEVRSGGLLGAGDRLDGSRQRDSASVLQHRMVEGDAHGGLRLARGPGLGFGYMTYDSSNLSE